MTLRAQDKQVLKIMAGFPKDGATLHFLRVAFGVRNAASDDSLRGSLRSLVAKRLAVRDQTGEPMTYKLTDAGRRVLATEA